MNVSLVAPAIWRISTPLPYRPREVHSYLAQTAPDVFLLVDGGADTADAWAALDAGILRTARDWRRVGTHAVTHMHLDHMGLVRRTREASGARLLMGRLDAERAAHADAAPAEEAAYRRALLRESGAPAALFEALESGRGSGAARPAFVAADATLDGEGGDLPGAPGWRWLWTPGHTAGHVSLHREADGVLIAGDAVLPRITPTIGVNRQRADPVADYLAALARVEALRPRLVLAGHGEPIDDPLPRLRALHVATVQETEVVFGWLTEEPTTAWQIAGRRHPRPELPPATRMLALREALAHLQHLESLGRARRVPLGAGVVGFARDDG